MRLPPRPGSTHLTDSTTGKSLLVWVVRRRVKKGDGVDSWFSNIQSPISLFAPPYKKNVKLPHDGEV